MKETNQAEQLTAANMSGISRRKFFGLAGGVAGAGLVLGAAGCKTDDGEDGVNLGSNDTGILNFAYALEQLEAAFYTQVIKTPFNGMTQDEKSRLTEIRDHEIAHREFFKQVLGANAIANLEVNFSTIDFSKRQDVISKAMYFEDLGVAAYNGAAQYISDPNILSLAGKIVSVEARHAAYIRDVMEPGSFAGRDIIDNNGLDVVRKPADVLAMASVYIYTKINAGNLPTN